MKAIIAYRPKVLNFQLVKSDSYLIGRIPVAFYLTKFKVPALIISLPLNNFNSIWKK